MRTTLIVVLVAALVLAVYDVVIGMLTGGVGTISWTLYTYSQLYPTIPFAFGYLMGHVFGQMRTGKSVDVSH